MSQNISLAGTDDHSDGRRFPRITDDALDNLRRLIGVPITRTVEPWCYEATRDNIRHYAHGVGDDNPLWCDPHYAAGTQYGDVIAPPSFVFALNRVLSGYVGGLPGVHAMWAGADLEWFEPIRRNVAVSTEVHLEDLVEHQTRFAGRAIQQIYHVEIRDGSTLLCRGDSWCFRTERDAAREEGSKYAQQKAEPRPVYDASDIEEIWEYYRREEIRGATPRYFEDVTVGEELPPMAKGPMTVTGFIAFAQGWGGLYIRSNKLAFEQFRAHPGLAIPNASGIPDVPERVHWEDELAREVGTPGAYDYGPERCSWLIHQLTNWMGDDGFLRSQRTEVRHHNVVGDWILISATVTGKTLDDDGRALVEVEQEARNQNGALSALGTATVQLPQRSNAA